jgi:hypothetical protein
MSDTKGGLRIVALDPSGWCDPVTGTCHIDAGDEQAAAEAGDESATGAVPDTTER